MVISQAAILERIIDPEQVPITPEVGHYLLSLDIRAADRQRLEELRAKARKGEIAPAEQAELDSFHQVGRLLADWQAKARQALGAGPAATGTEATETSLEVAPGILRSMRAFWRDLPGLLPLKSRKRRWVAYYGEERIGFGRTQAELYQECFRRGFKDSEFFVGRVEPRPAPPWEVEEMDPSLYEFGEVDSAQRSE